MTRGKLELIHINADLDEQQMRGPIGAGGLPVGPDKLVARLGRNVFSDMTANRGINPVFPVTGTGAVIRAVEVEEKLVLDGGVPGRISNGVLKPGPDTKPDGRAADALEKSLFNTVSYAELDVVQFRKTPAVAQILGQAVFGTVAGVKIGHVEIVRPHVPVITEIVADTGLNKLPIEAGHVFDKPGFALQVKVPPFAYWKFQAHDRPLLKIIIPVLSRRRPESAYQQGSRHNPYRPWGLSEKPHRLYPNLSC